MKLFLFCNCDISGVNMLLRDQSSGNRKQVSLNRVRARSTQSYTFQGSKNKQHLKRQHSRTQREKTNILQA